MNYYENQGGNNPSVYWLQGEVKRGRKPHFSDLAIGLIALQLQYSRTTAIAQRHTQPDTGPEERTSRLPSPGEEAAAAERGDGEASRRRRFFSATRRRRGLGALVVAGAVSGVCLDSSSLAPFHGLGRCKSFFHFACVLAIATTPPCLVGDLARHLAAGPRGKGTRRRPRRYLYSYLFVMYVLNK